LRAFSAAEDIHRQSTLGVCRDSSRRYSGKFSFE
jgi:hypothetical protein